MTVRELAARIDPGQVAPQTNSGTTRNRDVHRDSQFADELRRAREHDATGFKLSAHARERIEQRGISLDASQQQSLNEALYQLEEKGSKDALLLRSDAAFIVNVPTRTVVTALETGALKERVFTQIDSALMLQ